MPTTTATEPVIALAAIEVSYRVLTERIGSFKEYVLKRLAGRVEHKLFPALGPVDLEIARGEFLGVVGRNGAGKSTLLKVVSRVLQPTAGRLVLRGRVAPMLELGAGFHPDLTGLENVFLNGAILGHGRREMEQNLDEVIRFSELEAFVDAPIRTYSSGMVARLGFAVATQFRPDVLILDEILGVGDLGFQQKCFERIRRFQERGTTILLVSHDLDVVEGHCARAIWLERGTISAAGPAREVVDRYRESFDATA